jgi:hypothetical protein
VATCTQASILEYLDDLPDPRGKTDSKLHLLIDIVVLDLCAITAEFESFPEMKEFGKQKRDWFKNFLRLPNGIRSHDTIRRVLSKLDARRFHECFVR